MNLFIKKDKEENTKKAADKLFLQSFIISVIGALVTITALSTSTWAWFASSIGSNTSTIEVGYCDMKVSIAEKSNDNEASTASNFTDPADSAYNMSDFGASGYYYFLKEGKTYNITFIPEGTATTCYCRINIGGVNYFTNQLAVEEGIFYELEITAAVDSDMTIYLGWGTANVDDRDFDMGESYTASANGVILSSEYVAEEKLPADKTPTTPEVKDDNASAPAESKNDETENTDSKNDESANTDSKSDETPMTPEGNKENDVPANDGPDNGDAPAPDQGGEQTENQGNVEPIPTTPESNEPSNEEKTDQGGAESPAESEKSTDEPVASE